MKYPPTPVAPVTDVYHGEPVVDHYRWLEEGDSPAVQAWTEAQNGLTEQWLNAIPARTRIRARLQELLAIGVLGCPTPVQGRYLYVSREGMQNQPVLYVRVGLDGAERIAIDPNALSRDGTTALDWYEPSIDGRLLAYGLSADGSEQSTLRVLDLDTGIQLSDEIPHTRAADVAWLPDRSGFYYTRYPAPGDVPDGEEHYHRSVFFHRLGDDPSRDDLVFKPAEKEFWPGVSLSDDGRWLLLSVSRGFDRNDLFVQDRIGGAPFVAVAEDLPCLFDGQIVRGTLFLRTNEGAPNYRLISVSAAAAADRGEWREIVAARDDAVLSSVRVTARRLALDYLERASARLCLANLDGSNVVDVPLPTFGSLFGLGSEPDGEELLYGFSSYTVPPSVYRVELTTGATRLWRRVEAGIDPERFVVEQVSYPSKDGTPISMFLVHRRELERIRSAPAYLTGYGGFNLSMTPAFARSLMLWLEHGGVLAVPNLRGGGEYGEAWHQAGMLAQKQNTFDDFVAAASWLVDQGYTAPERLAIAGGSNGGLLMGAALTQRPELFRAVVVQVPLLDMLRYHRFLIARLWIPEYGSADDPAQYAWLKAYSPYQAVRDGVAYPAALFATAESDTRVDPFHARKMVARLQAATSSGRPTLLRLESKAGHGAGKPLTKVLEELTDTWTFIFRELGLA